MKIWHDNSGKNEMASWFLKFIIIKDLQTGEKFYFLCQDWLAVEKSDGKIERELFVACNAQKSQIKYLMNKQAKHYMMENHMWFSVFYRPIQSSFTRLDRVTCCFVFHYLSMLLNIIYFGVISTSSNSSKVSLNFVGVFSINLDQVLFNHSLI